MNCPTSPTSEHLPCLGQVFSRPAVTVLVLFLLATFATQSALSPRLVLQRLLTPAQLRETEGHGEEPTQESRSIELGCAVAARGPNCQRFRRTELLPTTKDHHLIALSRRVTGRPADHASANGCGAPLRC